MRSIVNGLIIVSLIILIVAGYMVTLGQQVQQEDHSPAITLSGTAHPRGSTITAPENSPERVTVPGAEIILEPKAAITLLSCTTTPCTFRHDTGKITASGQAVFTVRAHTVAMTGETVLTHYSWLDTWNVKASRGTVTIDGTPHESGADVTITTKE